MPTTAKKKARLLTGAMGREGTASTAFGRDGAVFYCLDQRIPMEGCWATPGEEWSLRAMFGSFEGRVWLMRSTEGSSLYGVALYAEAAGKPWPTAPCGDGTMLPVCPHPLEIAKVMHVDVLDLIARDAARDRARGAASGEVVCLPRLRPGAEEGGSSRRRRTPC